MSTAAMASPGRVLGWDVLRGLCALGVATYHLLTWQGIADVYPLGSYGVYLFFVLSGASLAYTYAGKLTGPADLARFLYARWTRLAPLFMLVSLASIALFSAHHRQWVDHIPQRIAVNFSFAFGFLRPTIDALPIGGWSLGIEATYYLAFPAMLWAVRKPRLAALVALGLVALQAAWILRTVRGPEGFDFDTYHQWPAFIAYFFSGCCIGHWRRTSSREFPAWAGAAACVGMALLMVLLNSPEQGAELWGWRGAVLSSACIGVVAVCGHAKVPVRRAPIARWLGDITYGCYLLHPLVFFTLAWFVLPAFAPADVMDWPLPARLLFGGVVLVVACMAAAASERWFERPLRKSANRAFARRAAPAYIEASSIAR